MVAGLEMLGTTTSTDTPRGQVLRVRHDRVRAFIR
jgi:hypothetical protein